MSTLVLDILKFVAIAIGAVSGLVGTITESRDKSTGSLTRGGWTIVGLIVASSVVAGIIQAIEAHRKRVADKADRTQRLQEFEALYSLTHPLGDLRVQMNVTYPITGEIGGLDGTWLQRVRRSSEKSVAVLNDATDKLRPSPEEPEEAREFRLLIEPEFDLTLNRIPTQSGIGGEGLRDHGASLMFRTIKPTESFLYVDFDDKRIDIQINAQVVKLIDDGGINSWRDLYGAELILGGLSGPAGTRITRCTLSFSTGSQFATRLIEVPVTEINERLKLLHDPYINYVCILKEAELGPKPVLLH